MLLIAPFFLLSNAHAHNDYEHPRPLLDALDQGFLSVEADIYLVDGELQVGHDRKDLKKGRTLESLYLDPLAKRVKRNAGTVYGQPGTLILLVDLKEDGGRIQPVLAKHLQKYEKMLSERTGTTVQARAVQIILSGGRTEECANADGFFFKDGRPKDMADDPARTPLISEDYADALGTSESPLPSENRAKLDALVSAAHASHKKLRLWGTADGPTTWGELQSAGLDLINTDKLADLRAFLLSARKSR